jgi:hypothetical protein
MPTCVCGVENESGSRFCEACGKPLAALPAATQGVPKTGAQSAAKRQLVSGRTFPILLLGVAIVAGLFWWLNRSRAPYRLADPGLYPFIAADSTGADRMGFIDAQGNVVIQPQWDATDPDSIYDQLLFCNEGLCKVRKDGKFGFIDYTGRQVIPGQFDNARQFVNGLAAVSMGDQWGYVDKTGRYVINPRFSEAGNFLSDVAVVQSDGKWGLIDKSGKFAIRPIFDAIGKDGFVDGLAVAKLGDKIGYIDSHGEFVIAPQFDEADSFSEGRAPVRLGSKWGYINTSGKIVINPQFDRASRFIGGKAFVTISGRQGTINENGQYVINPGQYTLNPVAGAAGLLEVKTSDGIGLMSRDGSGIMQPSKAISRILISFGKVYYVIIFDKAVPITSSGKILAGWYKGDSISSLEQDIENEKSAVDSLRTLTNAEANYSTAHPTTGFASTLDVLGPATDPADQVHAGLIDAALATGTKDGYQFTAKIPDGASTGGVNSNYTITASPLSGHAGRIFCTDSSRVIRYATAGQECTVTSPAY